jgi:signal transduction histidine kinase
VLPSLGDFVERAAHELRTPLGAILMWVDVLAKDDTKEHRQHAAEAIERSTRAQLALIEDMLDLARTYRNSLRLTLESVDVARLVREAAHHSQSDAQAKGITLELCVSADNLALVGDARRLERVFSNLIANAVRFTPPGGRVTARATQEPGAISVAVQDTGRGMGAADLATLFTPFYERSDDLRRGTELGVRLAVARHIVELHGGRIAAESGGLGQGATFSVSLPLDRQLDQVRPPASGA